LIAHELFSLPVFLEGEHVFLGDFGLAKDISQRARHHPGEMEELDPFWEDMVVRKQEDGSSSDSDGEVVLKDGWEDTFARKLAEEADNPNAQHTQNNLTLGVGTLLYASPEQLARRRYDSKTDIYSLGVLFFELYYPFSTPMERVYTLMELRKGSVPQTFRMRYPSEWNLLRKMIAVDPKERPTANEILGSYLLREHEARLYQRSSTSPSLHSASYFRGETGAKKRASSASGEGINFAGFHGKGSSANRGRSLGAQRNSRMASPVIPQENSSKGRNRGSVSFDASASRLQTEVGELIVGSESSSGALGKAAKLKSGGKGRRGLYYAGEASTGSLRSDSTTSTDTSADSDDFTGDSYDVTNDSSFTGISHESERRRLNAARFAVSQRRAADSLASKAACVECKEKDIMILALRERNRKLMDRVHELERELQLVRSGGQAVGLPVVPRSPATRLDEAVPEPANWGLAQPSGEPPAIPARPSMAPGGFPRLTSGPPGFPRSIAVPPPASPRRSNVDSSILGPKGRPAPPVPSLFGMIPRPPPALPPSAGQPASGPGRATPSIPVPGRAPPPVPGRP
jgi:serine/threonine protein kinase